MKNIFRELADRIQSGETVALATIIETKGSTPQVPGASALFSPDGLISGTLGGGWVEAAAEKKTLSVICTGKTLIAGFALHAGIDADTGAICGGDIRVLIDTQPAAHLATFENLLRSIRNGRRGILAAAISPCIGEEVKLERFWIEEGQLNGATLFSSTEDIKKIVSSGRPHLLQEKDRFIYSEPVSPNPHLIIVGAGHIGKALTHLGHLLDFEVTVIDDREEFANSGMLPDADTIIVDKAEKALADLLLTPDTYIVIVTRGHLHDADALRRVINSDAAYIGMIGSRRKVALMREKFLQGRWATAEQFERVHAPIGIDIHSETVEEIAVSIAAELIRERRARG